MTRAGVAVLVLGLVASCAARTVVSEFRCELSAPASLPRENAEFLARLAGMSSVSVARALRLPELDHFRVKVAPDRYLTGGTHGGARLDAVPTILLGGVCLDDHSLFMRIVWHELVHIYLLELDAGLPDMLQEGIAEYMGISSQPPEQSQFELAHRIGFEELVGMLHDRELLEHSLEAALDPAPRPTGGAR